MRCSVLAPVLAATASCSMLVPSSGDLTGGTAADASQERDATRLGGWTFDGTAYTWSFEEGCGGWRPHDGREVLATESALVRSAPAACRVCPGAVSEGEDFGASIPSPVQLDGSAVTYTVDVWGRVASGGPMTLHLNTYSDASQTTPAAGDTQISAASWARVSASGTTARELGIYVRGRDYAPGECFVIDDVTVHP
jgi:hypothetical protein